MGLGWNIPCQGCVWAFGAVGSVPSCTLHLTWLISSAENWMALLPMGLGRGGKRRRRALGMEWLMRGGNGGGGVSGFGDEGALSPLFGQVVDGSCSGETKRDAQVLQIASPHFSLGTWG